MCTIVSSVQPCLCFMNNLDLYKPRESRPKTVFLLLLFSKMAEKVNPLDSLSVHKLHGFYTFVFFFLTPNDHNDEIT